MRPPDDFQPRKQLSFLFDDGKLDAKDAEGIKTFCKKYLVTKECVLEHLHHKTELNL
jgi:hypothetical protein